MIGLIILVISWKLHVKVYILWKYIYAIKIEILEPITKIIFSIENLYSSGSILDKVVIRDVFYGVVVRIWCSTSLSLS